MARKKKPAPIQKIRKKLKGALKDLGVIEKDVEKVRENLRRFLQRGIMHSESYDKQKRKFRR